MRQILKSLTITGWHKWLQSSFADPIAADAIAAGRDDDGSPIYIGRAPFASDLVVANVVPWRKAAYLTHDSTVHEIKYFEILIGSGFNWVLVQDGILPDSAVMGGYTADGTPMFIGRAPHKSRMIVGKVMTGQGEKGSERSFLFIPFPLYTPVMGSPVEIRLNVFEVLTL